MKANIRAGNLGKKGSRRRTKAESKPIAFRPEAAHPFDDRCLSWQYDARTVSIWTTAGRIGHVRFACSADGLNTLREHRKGESDLIERDGVFYLIVVCDLPQAPVNEKRPHHRQWCPTSKPGPLGPGQVDGRPPAEIPP